ncbi:hypothetical protein [Providencia sp. Me31A]|uniref:hypothetical protein n=1 Tax=Providencia sp. Me31A TaxID=3392637 RepID=UPI003D2B8C15
MSNKLKYTSIGLFVFLGASWLILSYFNENIEKSNTFTVSQIKYDNTTYRYVKEKCDSGFFEKNSENCINLRAAR